MNAATLRALFIALASACVALSGGPTWTVVVWTFCSAAWLLVFVLELIAARLSKRLGQ